MSNLMFIVFLLGQCHLFLCELVVSNVIVRVPKENDIGLIFDLTVTNNAGKTKELLQFFVRSNGPCTLNVTLTEVMGCASRMFGGEFGCIEPGKRETVSLIWPTVSLYNRVGFCPIVVTSSNSRNEETHLQQLLYFDTRFETLDPESRSLRKNKNYRDCGNWDKEYLKNCTPVNCEERYFGKRSFYNFKTERCDPVPLCASENLYYDYFSNECVDSTNFVTAEDIDKIRKGVYNDNFLELRASVPEMPDEPNICRIKKTTEQTCPTKMRTLWDLNECLHFEGDTTAGDAAQNRYKKYAFQKFYSDWMWLLQGVKSFFIDDSQSSLSASSSAASGSASDYISNLGLKRNTDHFLPNWISALLNGFLLVVATVIIYLIICFIIFLIITWIMHKQKNGDTKRMAGVPPEPSDCVSVMTTSSLLSQR